MPVKDQSWYTLRASGEAEQRSIEVFVYGEIGTWGASVIVAQPLDLLQHLGR